LLNFAGWIGLTTGVVLAYQCLDPGDDTTAATHAGAAGGSQAGHGAALVLLSYFLPAAAWALKRRRYKYLLCSAPFTVTLWAALKGRAGAS
jgi:hypothetical protein